MAKKATFLVRVSEEEKLAWELASGGKLSTWVREVCNAAAANLRDVTKVPAGGEPDRWVPSTIEAVGPSSQTLQPDLDEDGECFQCKRRARVGIAIVGACPGCGGKS